MKILRVALLYLLTAAAILGGVGPHHELGVNAADATVVCTNPGDCSLLAKPQSTQATILLNQSWDATGIGGAHTTYCCATIIQPATIAQGLELLHGGGGDEFDVCREFEGCTLATLPYTITGAVWDSTYGGRTTFTLSADPGNTVVEGNVLSSAGVQSTGGTGVGFNGNGWTVLSVHSGSAPYTISVSQPALSSPGTFTACGGGGGQPACGTATVLTITPDSIIYAWVNTFNVAIALPQGHPPLGGTDAGNTPAFTGTIVGNQLTVPSPPSTGVIALPQAVSAVGATGPPVITAKAPGTIGYAGTYTVTPSQTGTVGPEAMTANGCPIAPNTQTWSNGTTTSCLDDSTRLDALSKAMQVKYGLPAAFISCLGHSEGAGMCAKLMFEHAGDFGHIGSVSMPWALYYDAAGGGHTTLPAEPYWLLVGAADTVVCQYPAGDPNCYGTPNIAHVTVSGTALVAQTIDSGALTAGNVIISGALPGTMITACSDATHCTITPSQTIASSTQIKTNNLFSTQIGNNSTHYTTADFFYPLATLWPGYANVIATAANNFNAHGCPWGGGSQIHPADATIANPGTSIEVITYDYCNGYIELNVVPAGAHDMRSITYGMPSVQQGGLPPLALFLQHNLKKP